MAAIPFPCSAPATSNSARALPFPVQHHSVLVRASLKRCQISCRALPLNQDERGICLAAGKHRSVPRRHVSCRCSSIGTAVEPGWKDEDFIEVGTLGRPHGIRGEVVVSIDTSFPEERFANPGVRYIQAPPARGMFVSRPNEAPREVELISGRPHVTKGNTVWLLRFKQIKDRDDAETLRNYKMLIHKSQRAQVDEEDEFYSQDLVGLTVLLNPYHAAAQPAVEDDSGSAAPSSSGHQIEAGAASSVAVDTKSIELEGQDANASKNGDGSIGNVKVDAVKTKTVEAEEDESGLQGEEEIVFWDVGTVTDVYDGTGTHGVLRIDFSSGLIVQPDGTLQRVSDMKGRTKESGLLPFARDIVPEIDLEEGVMVIDPPIGWLEMYLTPSKAKKRKRFRKPKSPKTPAVAVVEPTAVA